MGEISARWEGEMETTTVYYQRPRYYGFGGFLFLIFFLLMFSGSWYWYGYDYYYYDSYYTYEDYSYFWTFQLCAWLLFLGMIICCVAYAAKRRQAALARSAYVSPVTTVYVSHWRSAVHSAGRCL